MSNKIELRFYTIISNKNVLVYRLDSYRLIAHIDSKLCKTTYYPPIGPMEKLEINNYLDFIKSNTNDTRKT